MKTFLKKNLIAVFALLLGIATMSFKMAEKTTPSTQIWYYTETTTDGHNDYQNYVPAEGPYFCLSTSDVRCTIEAPEDSTHEGYPDLSDIQVLSRKN